MYFLGAEENFIQRYISYQSFTADLFCHLKKHVLISGEEGVCKEGQGSRDLQGQGVEFVTPS